MDKLDVNLFSFDAWVYWMYMCDILVPDTFLSIRFMYIMVFWIG